MALCHAAGTPVVGADWLLFETIGQLTPEEKGVARAVLEGLLLKHATHRFSTTVPNI